MKKVHTTLFKKDNFTSVFSKYYKCLRARFGCFLYFCTMNRNILHKNTINHEFKSTSR